MATLTSSQSKGSSRTMKHATVTTAQFQLVTDLARTDTKKRISLGSVLLASTGSFAIYTHPNGEVLLKPVQIVPAGEAWLHHDKPALARVQQGLRESAAGLTRSLGSFAKHAQA